MTDEERARAWFALCDNGNGVVVPLPMNVRQLADEFAKVRAASVEAVVAFVRGQPHNADAWADEIEREFGSGRT